MREDLPRAKGVTVARSMDLGQKGYKLTNADALALSVHDAGTVSGLGRTSLYKAIRDGALPAHKAGRRTLILRRDLETYLSSLPTIR